MYIVLLRGINISGKNRVAMSELKQGFEEIELLNVKTYINSGNVIFDSELDKKEIIKKITTMIKEKFNLDIPITIITKEELEDILNNHPIWWGTDNKEIYDNLIFMIEPTKIEEVHRVVGEPKEEYEQIEDYKNVIFWSFHLKTHNKSNWYKIPNTAINDKVTIRTANTMRKLLEISGG